MPPPSVRQGVAMFEQLLASLPLTETKTRATWASTRGASIRQAPATNTLFSMGLLSAAGRRARRRDVRPRRTNGAQAQKRTPALSLARSRSGGRVGAGAPAIWHVTIRQMAGTNVEGSAG